MLTPQEIKEQAFVKAVFGGYDMTGVDEFLDVVTADYTALYKENAILKGKLKVLVEKVEEYRSTEDSMRMALLTAQRVGEEIKFEANKQRDAALRGAEDEIKARLSDTAKRVSEEELRLSVAARETQKFIELSQAVIQRHSEFLSKLEAATRVVLPDSAPSPQSSPQLQQPMQPLQPPPLQQQPLQQAREEHVLDVASQIDNAVQRLTGSDSPSPQQAFAQPPVQQGFAQPAAQQQGYASMHGGNDQTSLLSNDPLSAPTMQIPPLYDEQASSPRPKFDFDDLKFGANFDSN